MTTDPASEEAMVMAMVDDGFGNKVMRLVPASTVPAPKGKRKRAKPATLPNPIADDVATDQRLCLLLDRIDRLEEEKKGIADDIRDVYAEGKAIGYDPKMMRTIRELRLMNPSDRAEQEMIRETYKCAVGLE